MMLLEEVVAMFPGEEAGGFPRETSEAGNAEAEEGEWKRPNSRKKLDSASLGVTSAMEWMANSRKAGRLASSSET